jgi:hypothetical protein
VAEPAGVGDSGVHLFLADRVAAERGQPAGDLGGCSRGVDDQGGGDLGGPVPGGALGAHAYSGHPAGAAGEADDRGGVTQFDRGVGADAFAHGVVEQRAGAGQERQSGGEVRHPARGAEPGQAVGQADRLGAAGGEFGVDAGQHFLQGAPAALHDQVGVVPLGDSRPAVRRGRVAVAFHDHDAGGGTAQRPGGEQSGQAAADHDRRTVSRAGDVL